MMLEDELYRKICENLQLLRSYYGYTQRQVADVLCCRRSTYAYVEEGKSALSVYRLYVLSELYRLPPEALWSDLRTNDVYRLRERPEVLDMRKKTGAVLPQRFPDSAGLVPSCREDEE